MKHMVHSVYLWACPADTYCFTCCLGCSPHNPHRAAANPQQAWTSHLHLHPLKCHKTSKAICSEALQSWQSWAQLYPCHTWDPETTYPHPHLPKAHTQNRSESLMKCCGSFDSDLKYSPKALLAVRALASTLSQLLRSRYTPHTLRPFKSQASDF